MFAKFCKSKRMSRSTRALFYDWLKVAGFGDTDHLDTFESLYPRFVNYLAARVLEMRKLAALLPAERL